LWNPKLCNGAGGCAGAGWNAPDPFRCNDGTRLNPQQTASEQIASGLGAYDVITGAQFPTSCLPGVKPGDSDTLVMYMWIREVCTEKKPVKDCYNQNPNPASYTICQIVDSKDQMCVMNPKAGECESWGSSAGRDQCRGWTPGKPDSPRES
ncbi:hypothetical protein GQ44DRAFT_633384, partial [Phaeosphaeriaceae sp. PMI808]